VSSDTPQVVCLHDFADYRPLQAPDQAKRTRETPNMPTNCGSPDWVRSASFRCRHPLVEQVAAAIAGKGAEDLVFVGTRDGSRFASCSVGIAASSPCTKSASTSGRLARRSVNISSPVTSTISTTIGHVLRANLWRKSSTRTSTDPPRSSAASTTRASVSGRESVLCSWRHGVEVPQLSRPNAVDQDDSSQSRIPVPSMAIVPKWVYTQTERPQPGVMSSDQSPDRSTFVKGERS